MPHHVGSFQSLRDLVEEGLQYLWTFWNIWWNTTMERGSLSNAIGAKWAGLERSPSFCCKKGVAPFSESHAWPCMFVCADSSLRDVLSCFCSHWHVSKCFHFLLRRRIQEALISFWRFVAMAKCGIACSHARVLFMWGVVGILPYCPSLDVSWFGRFVDPTLSVSLRYLFHKW